MVEGLIIGFAAGVFACFAALGIVAAIIGTRHELGQHRDQV